MTGFGRGDAAYGGGLIIVELTTLNSRYLEVQVRGLRDQGELELLVRERVSKTLQRGKATASIAFAGVKTTERNLTVDIELAKLITEEYGKLAHNLGISTSVPPEAILSNDSVFNVTEVNQANEEIAPQLLEALNKALAKLLSMRRDEGERLVFDIQNRFDDIGKVVDEIVEKSSGIVSDYRKRLKKATDELLQNGIDQGRLEQELVLYADRADITEEITRLRSHLEQVNKTLENGGRIGRRLDFIIQEINRELNTIGSKSSKAEVSGAVVRGKDLLEQIREQVQNIE